MIGGMMKTAMIAAVAYARRGVQAAMSDGDAAEQARDEHRLEQELRDRRDLVGEPRRRIGRHEDAPDEQDELWRDIDGEERRPSGR